MRIPRAIPDEKFDELFAALGSHRDRALVAFWVSTGARAAELLGATCADADPGQQLITVIRKGTPVSAAAAGVTGCVRVAAAVSGADAGRGAAPGADQPLWWTLRKPFRPLTYHAARAMFVRANALLGSNWSLHDLRHTAAYRMARDPQMPLTDVQWVLGHAHLSTTQLYLTAPVEDVIAAVLAHHARRAQPQAAARRCGPVALPASSPWTCCSGRDPREHHRSGQRRGARCRGWRCVSGGQTGRAGHARAFAVGGVAAPIPAPSAQPLTGRRPGSPESTADDQLDGRPAR